MSLDIISSNVLVFYGIVKNIEIIGEVAYNLTNAFRSSHKETPWKNVMSMRNDVGTVSRLWPGHGLLRLQALAVLAGRLAKVLGAVAAEVREGGKIHPFGYLGERQALVIQIVF